MKESNFTSRKQKAFLAAFEECGNLSEAARVAKIARRNHFRWLKEQPKYVQLFADAEQVANDKLESEARRRAVEGFHEPVFHKGVVVGAIKRFSDQLLIFLMKNRIPAFRDKMQHEHTVNVDLDKLTPQQRQAILDDVPLGVVLAMNKVEDA